MDSIRRHKLYANDKFCKLSDHIYPTCSEIENKLAEMAKFVAELNEEVT